MEENSTYENFMDFLLSGESETFDNGLSHPSVEFENNERRIAIFEKSF